MSRMSNIKCQMSTMSNFNNIKWQQCQICPDLLRSVEIRPDQSRSYEICLIMSKCQSNCQNVNQIVLMSNVMCSQSVD